MGRPVGLGGGDSSFLFNFWGAREGGREIGPWPSLNLGTFFPLMRRTWISVLVLEEGLWSLVGRDRLLVPHGSGVGRKGHPRRSVLVPEGTDVCGTEERDPDPMTTFSQLCVCVRARACIRECVSLRVLAHMWGGGEMRGARNRTKED